MRLNWLTPVSRILSFLTGGGEDHPPKDIEMLACKKCKYYSTVDDSLGWGECRRYPPKVSLTEKGNDIFPVVDEADWCGEFVQKLMSALQLE